MKIYKVGGAVRDQLLGYPHSEIDWVVVGATPEDLLSKGYSQVGKDFPVFLHPKTKEEYALARTERKSGHGYHGFVVHADPSVTLEEDLERRDLTINAMALAEDGAVIDPYGGQQDLHARTLRHVSAHFVEDPLRVLRVARFAARYSHLDFTIAPDTMALMTAIVAQGELAHLSLERIWVETERALGEPNPEVYFQVLKDCGALQTLLPAVAVTTGIDWLARAKDHTERTDCRWAALLAPLPAERATQTSAAIKAPKAFSELASKTSDWRTGVKSALTDGAACMALLQGLDALRRDEPLLGFCETVAALEGSTAVEHPTTRKLVAAKTAALNVRAADLAAEGLQGPALGDALNARRIEVISALIEQQM